MTIADPAEAPRARLLRAGARSLSDAELLAVVLGNGRAGASALDLAVNVLVKAGGLSGLTSHPERLRCNGMGRAKLAAVLAVAELACRVAAAEVPDRRPLKQPGAVARYVDLRYGRRDQEVMGALYCDARHRLICERELYRGTLHRAAVEPREVLRQGLLCGAAAVVAFHTHPSGDPAPSREDILFTRRLLRAGEVVGVHLVDHLVIAAGGAWESIRERGGWS